MVFTSKLEGTHVVLRGSLYSLSKIHCRKDSDADTLTVRLHIREYSTTLYVGMTQEKNGGRIQLVH